LSNKLEFGVKTDISANMIQVPLLFGESTNRIISISLFQLVLSRHHLKMVGCMLLVSLLVPRQHIIV